MIRKTSASKGEKVISSGFLSMWHRLLAACRHHAFLLVLALLFAIAGTVLAIIAPLVLATLTNLIRDHLNAGIPYAAALELCLHLLLLYGGSALFTVLARWLTAGVTQHASHHLRFGILKKINRLSVTDCENTVTGDLLSRVTNDVDSVGHAMHEGLGELLPACTLLLGSLLMMLLTNVIMAVVAVLATLLGFLLLRWMMDHSQKYFRRQQERLGELTGHVEEVYHGRNAVRACNGERRMRETFGEMNRKLERAAFRARFFAGMMTPLMSFVGNLGYLAVCVTGALLAVYADLSLGVIVAFMIFVHSFTHPLKEIAAATHAVQSAVAAGERVFSFLDMREMPQEHEDDTKLLQVTGHLRLCNVSYRYPGAEHDAVKHVSFSLRPGEKLGIVGSSGAGKSTLVDLLTGVRAPTEGEILIDGINIATLPASARHRLFATVLRNAWLFEGTVRENLLYGSEGVSDEQMRDVCRAIGIDGDISALKDGYDTRLGHEGVLSQGQLQQLGIARALLSSHPMLVLDEATAVLDPCTERRISEATEAVAGERTTVVLAHRAAPVENADLILVMREGEVAERGTPAELLQSGGFYASLCKAKPSSKRE